MIKISSRQKRASLAELPGGRTVALATSGHLDAIGPSEVRYLKQMVDDLRRERDTWQNVTLSLQAQLALPRR